MNSMVPMAPGSSTTTMVLTMTMATAKLIHMAKQTPTATKPLRMRIEILSLPSIAEEALAQFGKGFKMSQLKRDRLG
jgi:hypothetical protein